MRVRSAAVLATLIFVASLGAWLVPPAAAETVGRRYALLVGVSSNLRRGVPRLNFVDNDIEQLARLLRRQGYEVRTVPNDRADRRRILEELYAHVSTLTEQDTFVLYYAGHGVRNVEVNMKTYWLTDDADVSMLDVQGIRLEHLLSYVDDIRASRKLILLDHCYSGDIVGLRQLSDLAVLPTPAPPPAVSTPTEAEASGPRVTRHATLVGDIKPELMVKRRAGTTVIAAARDEAFELATIRHGVFTKALLDACSETRFVADRHYRRSIIELPKFLQERVDRLLKESGAPPQVLDNKLPEVAAELDWFLCAVPVPADEVTAKAAEYATTIQGWETKGLLGPDRAAALRRVACTEVLDKWKGGKGDQSALTDREHRILAAIRFAADPNDLRPEQVRADDLADALRREGV